MSVHSLHIWSLTADIPVLSVHLTTKQDADHNIIRNEAIKCGTLASLFNFKITIDNSTHLVAELCAQNTRSGGARCRWSLTSRS